MIQNTKFTPIYGIIKLKKIAKAKYLRQNEEIHVNMSEFSVHGCEQKSSWQVRELRRINSEAKTLKLCFQNEEDKCIPDK